jgi:hypothetical protein
MLFERSVIQQLLDDGVEREGLPHYGRRITEKGAQRAVDLGAKEEWTVLEEVLQGLYEGRSRRVRGCRSAR